MQLILDITSLQNFVTVALATSAGEEGDMTTDRLLYLRTIGSGFGPLIYNLPQTANFQEFQEHCKSLWETLDHAPSLPKMMVISYVIVCTLLLLLESM